MIHSDRFMEKVRITHTCWTWIACRNSDGYGFFSLNGKSVRAHRLAYECAVGPIPEGLVIDHLCSNRACVNPDHLQVVVPADNTRLRDGRTLDRCKRGHLFNEENTFIKPNGCRDCRVCRRARQRAARRRAWRAATGEE